MVDHRADRELRAINVTNDPEDIPLPHEQEDDIALKMFCRFCRAKDYCLPAECKDNCAYKELDDLVQHRRVVHKNTCLLQQGASADYLIVLSAGTCKSYFMDAKCREHVCGFFYPGDLIGTEALYSDQYKESTRMLETGCTCYIPVKPFLESLSRSPELLQQFLKMMSQQLWQEYTSAGNFSAEERLLQFLLVLAQKQKRLGYSDTQLRLFMSRNDIANYLGLRSETVSRLLTRLDKRKLLHVRRDLVDIREPNTIRELSGMPSAFT